MSFFPGLAAPVEIFQGIVLGVFLMEEHAQNGIKMVFGNFELSIYYEAK